MCVYICLCLYMYVYVLCKWTCVCVPVYVSVCMNVCVYLCEYFLCMIGCLAASGLSRCQWYVPLLVPSGKNQECLLPATARCGARAWNAGLQGEKQQESQLRTTVVLFCSTPQTSVSCSSQEHTIISGSLLTKESLVHGKTLFSTETQRMQTHYEIQGCNKCPGCEESTEHQEKKRAEVQKSPTEAKNCCLGPLPQWLVNGWTYDHFWSIIRKNVLSQGSWERPSHIIRR